jgi:rod shape-determining protein MreD
MPSFDLAKLVALVFLGAVLQVSVFSSVELLGGTPDLVLLTLVGVALLRGPVYGAAAGFAAGLVVDTANLATLGVTSLLLTLAGYWIGRYGEAVGRDRTHAPFLAVPVATFLYALGALLLHFLLGEPAPARVVLVDALFPTIFLNLLLTWPVYALCRRVLRQEPAERAREVRLLG